MVSIGSDADVPSPRSTDTEVNGRLDEGDRLDLMPLPPLPPVLLPAGDPVR